MLGNAQHVWIRVFDPHSLAFIRTSLDEVKEVAHRHGATVNGVLLALTAAGLRTLLRGRGEPVEGTTVRTYVPVDAAGNHGSQASRE